MCHWGEKPNSLCVAGIAILAAPPGVPRRHTGVHAARFLASRAAFVMDFATSVRGRQSDRAGVLMRHFTRA
jgi:hypothetical protein